MKKTALTILAVVVILGGGIALYAAKQNQTNEMQTKNNSAMTNKNSMEKQDESVMENKDATTKDQGALLKEDNKVMQTKPGTYVDYSPAALSDAAKNGKVVLFFWASWCPFCKTANEAFISKISDIPSGVTVLKTNYDTEKELKTKYGVTYQHTFVQVDSQGNMLAKWNGGDIDALKANIK